LTFILTSSLNKDYSRVTKIGNFIKKGFSHHTIKTYIWSHFHSIAKDTTMNRTCSRVFHFFLPFLNWFFS